MAMFHTNVLDNQIKALPTVSTASGSVATFDTDMTENLVEVKCQIVAQQSGSGTPSPSNPRPITTYSEMNVYLYGTNYVDMNDLVQGSFNINNGNDLASTTRVRTQNKIPVPSGTYNIFNAEKYEFVLYVYDENDAFIDGESLKSWQPYGTTITVNANRKIRLGWRKPDNSTMTPSDIHNVVCTSTANSTTENIPFGQTVAQGTLNVTTGVLEITHGVQDLGLLYWTASSSFNNVFFATITDLKNKTVVGAETAITETYPPDSTIYVAQMPDKTFITGATSRIYIKDSDYSDATSFKTSVNGVKCVFELTSPQIIQLSATQITALLNENNIWCDTNGDTSVKYILSVGKAVS